MKQTTVSVAYREQSKTVVAETKLEVIGEEVDESEVEKRARALFDTAFKYSQAKTNSK